MTSDLIAKATTTINAPADKVWEALINPDLIKKYMFGTTVTSEFKTGSTITWKGEWKGKAYEDKGEILRIAPEKELQYSHFSPLSGLEDKPENYHIVTIELMGTDNETVVRLTQDHNANEEEKENSQKNWMNMLGALKNLLQENK
jgi:uncharacterized protein YndB with AHSA1/START domain